MKVAIDRVAASEGLLSSDTPVPPSFGHFVIYHEGAEIASLDPASGRLSLGLRAGDAEIVVAMGWGYPIESGGDASSCSVRSYVIIEAPISPDEVLILAQLIEAAVIAG